MFTWDYIYLPSQCNHTNKHDDLNQKYHGNFKEGYLWMMMMVMLSLEAQRGYFKLYSSISKISNTVLHSRKTKILHLSSNRSRVRSFED